MLVAHADRLGHAERRAPHRDLRLETRRVQERHEGGGAAIHRGELGPVQLDHEVVDPEPARHGEIHEPAFPNNLLDVVIDILLEDRSYPKDLKGKAKARATDEKATGEISHNVANAAQETKAVVAVLDEVTGAANSTRGVADTVLAASKAVDTAAVDLRQRIEGFLQSVAV